MENPIFNGLIWGKMYPYFWKQPFFGRYGTWKSTCLKRKTIWTKPPWLWVPAVKFPRCISKVWFSASCWTWDVYRWENKMDCKRRNMERCFLCQWWQYAWKLKMFSFSRGDWNLLLSITWRIFSWLFFAGAPLTMKKLAPISIQAFKRLAVFHGTIWMFPKLEVGRPNHPILIGFSIINHPFWGTPIFGNTHLFNGYFGFYGVPSY